MLMDVKSLFALGGGGEQGCNVIFLFNCWRRLGMCIVIVASNRICNISRIEWVCEWVVGGL